MWNKRRIHVSITRKRQRITIKMISGRTPSKEIFVFLLFKRYLYLYHRCHFAAFSLLRLICRMKKKNKIEYFLEKRKEGVEKMTKGDD